MTTEHFGTIARAVQLGGWPIRLRPGMKQPLEKGWQTAGAITPAEADDYVSSGGNLGVHLGLSGMIAFDAENTLATAAVMEAGFAPTVIPAKAQYNGVLKPGLDDPSSGKQNAKVGGSHVWLRVPDTIDASQLSSDHSMQLTLPNGGLIDVLAGPKYVVAPPSALELTYGLRYMSAQGGPLDVTAAEPPDVVEAPMWLFDLAVPCPPEFAPLHGCLIPRVREQVEQSARSADLSAQIDEIGWDEWLAGEPRLTPTGEIDGCGCDIYYWQGSSNNKSCTLHDGCEQGNGVHVWSGTMKADLGLSEHHLSRLDLAVALRGESRSEVAASVGFSLGAERAEFEVVDGGEAASYAAFEAKAAAFTAAGNATEAYRWKERASRCALLLRSHHAYQKRAKAEAEAAGEVYIDQPIVGFEQLTPAQQATVTAPLPEGGAFQSVVLPEAPARPVQQDPGPYPVDALPVELRGFAVETAVLKNVPVALAAVPMVTTMAAACGPGHTWVRPAWVEPGALWFNVIAPPGAKKTPILKAAQACLAEAVKQIDEAQGAERRRALIRAKAAMKAADAAEAEAEEMEAERLVGRPLWSSNKGKSKADSAAAVAPINGIPEITNINGASWTPPPGMKEGDIDFAAELRQKADEAEDAVPAKAKLVIGDATPEKLHELLSTQNGRGFVVLSEAGRLLRAATREDSKAMDVSFWLDARDEAPIVVDRIGRGEVICELPSMCVLMMVQPDVWEAAVKPSRGGGPAAIDANGFNDRLLHTVITEVSPDVFFHDTEADPAVEAAYSDLIVGLFVSSYALGGERVKFRLSDDAQRAFAPIYEYVESVAKSGCGVRAQMWDKAGGSVVRLARCFAQCELGEISPADEHYIEPEHVVAAWRVIYWHLCSYGFQAGSAAAASEVELAEIALRKVREVLADGPKPWKGGLQNLRDVRTQKKAVDAAVETGELVRTEDGLYKLA